MKRAMYLSVTLRETTDEYGPLGFLLPVTRVWWEGVSNDLHLQFVGHEDRNICPHHNAHKDEMVIPKDAKVFRAWLRSVGAPHKGRIHIISNALEMVRPTKSMQIPPPAAIDDLINNWTSPNGPF